MCCTDRECIELCLDSHPEAFRRLVGRYQGALLAYLAGRMGDHARAEEAAQEALVRAFFSLERLKKPESFFSWLIGIANRVAKEQQRTERRQREAARPAFKQDPPDTVSCDRGLQHAMAELPDSYREIILLRYYAGLSCAQVAEELAVPLGTVTKKLSRAYAMLRDAMKRHGPMEKCSR